MFKGISTHFFYKKILVNELTPPLFLLLLNLKIKSPYVRYNSKKNFFLGVLHEVFFNFNAHFFKF